LFLSVFLAAQFYLDFEVKNMASSDSGDAFRKRSGIEQGLILHCVSIDRATRNVKCK